MAYAKLVGNTSLQPEQLPGLEFSLRPCHVLLVALLCALDLPITAVCQCLRLLSSQEGDESGAEEVVVDEDVNMTVVKSTSPHSY